MRSESKSMEIQTIALPLAFKKKNLAAVGTSQGANTIVGIYDLGPTSFKFASSYGNITYFIIIGY